jgi:hypothetical protein
MMEMRMKLLPQPATPTGMKISLLHLISIALLTGKTFALDYEHSKTALQDLDRLKSEKLISAEEYAKRRQAIIDSVNGNGKSSRSFTSELFTATFRRILEHGDGELTIEVAFLKKPSPTKVRICLPAWKDVGLPLQELGMSFATDDGSEYKVMKVTGIERVDLREDSAPISDSNPTIVSFRFRRTGVNDEKMSSNGTFAAPVAVLVQTDRDSDWKKSGVVTVHFDGLAPPAKKQDAKNVSK